jgi:hypothetical protein
LLFTTAAFTTNSDTWANTAPTSTVWSSNTPNWWATNQNLVAYSWIPVAGFSQFGSYTGNGSTDGPFIYLGFRPKFFMLKRTDASSFGWVIFDSTRNPYNAVGLFLYPNLSNAEGDYTSTDPFYFVSNGVKIGSNGSNQNASGGTYIYAAFAENPFKYANAR